VPEENKLVKECRISYVMNWQRKRSGTDHLTEAILKEAGFAVR
jgi:hypothetical protein